MGKRERADFIYSKLTVQYPDARCTLAVHSPERFLFTNILSPQCTDVVATRVSDELWERYRSVEAIAAAPISDLEAAIHDCGMYRVKAKHIKGSAALLEGRFGGEVPQDLEKLQEFPGIGRKTGLVIMQEAFGETLGIIIDTHNVRIVRLIGLTDEKDPVKIENCLMTFVPKSYWPLWSHLMVFHGRSICIARAPNCTACPIAEECDYGMEILAS